MSLIIYILSAFKTLIYNLRLFSLKEALKFPVVFHYRTQIRGLRKGSIKLNCCKTAVANIGFFDGIGGNNAEKTVLDFRNDGTLVLSGKTCIGKGSYLLMDGAEIKIGKNFHGGPSLIIVSRSSVIIGSDCLTSWNCTIMDSDGHEIVSDNTVINPPRPIKIGDHVWLGCNVTLLKGSTIPDNSIIGANTILSGLINCANRIYVNHIEGSVNKEPVEWKL